MTDGWMRMVIGCLRFSLSQKRRRFRAGAVIENRGEKRFGDKLREKWTKSGWNSFVYFY